MGESLGLLDSRESFNVHRVHIYTFVDYVVGSGIPLVRHTIAAEWSLNGADLRFAVQAAFAAYSVPAQSDKFYDLAGSLGFISTTLVSLVSHI